MGIFKKKEKEKCPICGQEMGFFSSKVVLDGTICENCEAMIRGDFSIEEYFQKKWGADGLDREDYIYKTSDPLSQMSIEEIREMVSEKQEKNEELITELGSEYANMARVESFFVIAPKPLDVGLKRSKELKNRMVATSLIVSGQFEKGDTVTVQTGSSYTRTTLLDVIPCSNSSSFETVLSSRLYKSKVAAGASAWLILDISEGLEDGTILTKN